jgi:hypothetical protein
VVVLVDSGEKSLSLEEAGLPARSLLLSNAIGTSHQLNRKYSDFLLSSGSIENVPARSLCRGSAQVESCQWYHAAWPTLRVLDLVSNPDWHGSFFVDAVSAYASEHPGDLRILVPATADATIVSHIRSGLEAVSPGYVRLDVFDACATPLRLVQDFMKSGQSNIDLNTRVVDARALAREGVASDSYDLIVADAFLTRFDSIDKAQVLREWTAALKTGGQVITTCRLGGNPRKVASADEISEFGARAIEAYLKFSGVDSRLGTISGAHGIRQLAEKYATRMSSSPIDAKGVTALFHTSRLRFKGPGETFVRGWTIGECEPTEYARIIAEKH